jgi:hypothetical protein
MNHAFEETLRPGPGPAEQDNGDQPYGEVKAFCSSRFDEVKACQKKTGTFPWGPFKSQEEWEFVEWAMESGLSHSEINKLVNLKVVSEIILECKQI